MKRILKPIIKKLRLPLKQQLAIHKYSFSESPYQSLQDEIDVLREAYLTADGKKNKDATLSKLIRASERLSNIYARNVLKEQKNEWQINGLQKKEREAVNEARYALKNELDLNVTQENLKHLPDGYIAYHKENQPLVDELLRLAQQYEEKYNTTGDKKAYRMKEHLEKSASSLCEPIQFDNRYSQIKKVKDFRANLVLYNYKAVRLLLKNWYERRYDPRYELYYLDIIQAILVTTLTEVEARVLTDYINTSRCDKKQSKSLSLAIRKIVKSLNDRNVYLCDDVNQLIVE